jgi:transposase
MMGSKERSFAQLVNVSLEDLVPADHFYRHLERTLDLSCVREFVQKTYGGMGRPSIDPIVFFKLQLVMFFEGIRSERQLMRHAADRLSVRWYVGYDLNEPLPDHSSLTRMRERYGVDVFRCFFEKIVDQCQEAGLVWGKELYIDATKVEANASLDSLTPRFAVEAHLANVFAEEAVALSEQQMTQEPAQRASQVSRLRGKSRGCCPSPSPRRIAKHSASTMQSAMTGWSTWERKIAASPFPGINGWPTYR